MATLADYPQPAHPERVGLPRYQDLQQYQRSLSALDQRLKSGVQDAREALHNWRLARNKKLSTVDKLFHGSKWKKHWNDESEVMLALATPYNRNWVTGAHYLAKFGWFDGDGKPREII